MWCCESWENICDPCTRHNLPRIEHSLSATLPITLIPLYLPPLIIKITLVMHSTVAIVWFFSRSNIGMILPIPVSEQNCANLIHIICNLVAHCQQHPAIWYKEKNIWFVNPVSLYYGIMGSFIQRSNRCYIINGNLSGFTSFHYCLF